MEALIVGEALSFSDNGVPFSDGNGRLFKALLNQAGINARNCEFLNVFNGEPPGRGPLSFFGPKVKAPTHMRPLKKGKYVRKEHLHHVERIRKQVNDRKPNLVIAVGEIAMWALTSETSIDASRGRVVYGNSALPEQKVLPVYSPRAVQGQYNLRPILMADLNKARRELEFPEIRRADRFIHLYPNLEDLEDFYTQYIIPASELSLDIETKGKIITCVGIATGTDRALVIPFFSEKARNGNYWKTARDEVMAWRFIRRVCKMGKPIKGQNFQYDMQYLWLFAGIPNPNFADDTMLMHHAMQPEMKKGLGFLASIYTDEPPWKFMHKVQTSDKSTKRED